MPKAGNEHSIHRLRWLATFAAPVLLIVSGFIPTIDRPQFVHLAEVSFFNGMLPFSKSFSLFAVNISGLLAAVFLVEFCAAALPPLRWMRSDAVGRRKLDSSSIAIGVLLTFALAYFAATGSRNALTYNVPAFGFGFSLIGVFLVGLASIFVVVATTKHGRANGFSIFTLWLVALSLAGKVSAAALLLSHGSISLSDLLVAISTLVAVALLTARFFDDRPLLAGRKKTTESSLRPMVNMPTAGIAPLLVFSVLSSSFATWVSFSGGTMSGLRFNSVAFVVAAVITITAFFLIARRGWPEERVAVALSTLLGRDVPRVEACAGKSERMLKEVALIALVIFLSMSSLGDCLSLGLFDYAAVVIVVAILRDLNSELGAEKRMGELEFVGRLSRTWEAGVLIEALGQIRSDEIVHVRGLWHRSLFLFFAPLVAIDVFAPSKHVPEVAAAMEKIRAASRPRTNRTGNKLAE